jgi:hypothetical protein
MAAVSRAIIVMTCARPSGVDYVTATAAALLEQGASDCDHRIILGDGSAPAAQPGWQTSGNAPQRGSRAALWAAFSLGLSLGVDRLIVCEDDLAVCRNAVRHALRLPIPERAAFVDFHDVKEFFAGHSAGLFLVPAMGFDGQGYWGNLCMAFPRRTLRWLVQRDPLDAPWPPPSHGDCALGWLLARSPWPNYVAHLPRLVRHVGVVSAAHPGEGLHPLRTTRDYPGDHFDALTLPYCAPMTG